MSKSIKELYNETINEAKKVVVSKLRLPKTDDAIGSYAIINNTAYQAVVKANPKTYETFIGLNMVKGHKGSQITSWWNNEGRTTVYGKDLYILNNKGELVKASDIK